MKMIGFLGVKKMMKIEIDIKRNRDKSKKVKESCMLLGFYLMVMRNVRKGVEVQLEIKGGKKIVKKIVNRVQIYRKMRDFVIIYIVIDQEDIVVFMIVVKLS